MVKKSTVSHKSVLALIRLVFFREADADFSPGQSVATATGKVASPLFSFSLKRSAEGATDAFPDDISRTFGAHKKQVKRVNPGISTHGRRYALARAKVGIRFAEQKSKLFPDWHDNARGVVFLTAISLLLSSCGHVGASSEFGRVMETPLAYKDFTLKTLSNDSQLQLSRHVAGKKLVMVVYFAPWCPNWKHELPLVSKLHDKYKDHGFGVVGVSEYGSPEDTKANFGSAAPPYPIVVESEARRDWSDTTHYKYRRAAGDKRKWGSPWHIFIVPDELSLKSEFMLDKAWVVNGELIEEDVDAFIRKRLDLP